jgi:hypothetical protein
MDIRNIELLYKRFDQVDGKIRHLRHLVGGQSTTQDFLKSLDELADMQLEIRSMVDRDTNPLRKG